MKNLISLAGGALLAWSCLAQAVLGGQIDSVTGDGAHFRAQLRAEARAAYTVQTLTQTNGTEIKEFVAPSGVVFAVSWRGPGRPDLQQLLGEHFASLQNEVANRPLRRVRTPVEVNHADVVIQMGGHMRAFTGLAYLPQQLPATVQIAELH